MCRRTPSACPRCCRGDSPSTYRFTGAGGDIAVRCFHREIPELLERYNAISAFLARLRSRFFVEFAYVARGIRIEAARLPIVRMQWVEGETLLGYVARRRADPHALAHLREQLGAFAEEGERSGYAHGDIQHRNFMVTPDGALKLVDYDGMYVPALRHLRAADGGHPHFQLPSRPAGDFGPRMDRFPLAVIDLSLEALQEAPGLFDKFHRGENLILSQGDFLDPANSPVLNAMVRIPRLAARVAAFSEVCGLPANAIPSLPAFRAMTGAAAVPLLRRHPAGPGPELYTSPFDVVDGMSFAAAVAAVGRPVETGWPDHPGQEDAREGLRLPALRHPVCRDAGGCGAARRLPALVGRGRDRIASVDQRHRCSAAPPERPAQLGPSAGEGDVRHRPPLRQG